MSFLDEQDQYPPQMISKTTLITVSDTCKRGHGEMLGGNVVQSTTDQEWVTSYELKESRDLRAPGQW